MSAEYDAQSCVADDGYESGPAESYRAPALHGRRRVRFAQEKYMRTELFVRDVRLEMAQRMLEGVSL